MLYLRQIRRELLHIASSLKRHTEGTESRRLSSSCPQSGPRHTEMEKEHRKENGSAVRRTWWNWENAKGTSEAPSEKSQVTGKRLTIRLTTDFLSPTPKTGRQRNNIFRAPREHKSQPSPMHSETLIKTEMWHFGQSPREDVTQGLLLKALSGSMGADEGYQTPGWGGTSKTLLSKETDFTDGLIAPRLMITRTNSHGFREQQNTKMLYNHIVNDRRV